LFAVVPAARSGGALKIARRPDCRLLEIRAVIIECGAFVLAYISSERRATSRRFRDRFVWFIDSASDCA